MPPLDAVAMHSNLRPPAAPAALSHRPAARAAALSQLTR